MDTKRPVLFTPYTIANMAKNAENRRKQEIFPHNHIYTGQNQSLKNLCGNVLF